ncbi:MAG TPA: SlyX family protein [Magnetospirillum sp.]|nr:SlyX family protein [Magnetospirillum sp.]
MDETLERRLVELETRIAHHERMTEELSSVIAEQGRTIDLLTDRMRRMIGRVREIEAGWERSPQDDKPPPHY